MFSSCHISGSGGGVSLKKLLYCITSAAVVLSVLACGETVTKGSLSGGSTNSGSFNGRKDKWCEQTVDVGGKLSVNCSHRALEDVTVFPEPDAASLHYLDLSFNCIKNITELSLSKLSELKVLNLSRNLIDTIETGAFHNLQSLVKLDLSFNSLRVLNSSVFAKLPKLKFLDLSSNHLSQLPNVLPMLELLDGSNNSIEVLEEQSYSTVLYPQRIFLIGENPFICDCSTFWLKELLDTRKYLLRYAKYIRPEKFFPKCSKPAGLRDKSWDKLKDADFNCETGIKVDIDNDATDSEGLNTVAVSAEEIGESFLKLKWPNPVNVDGLSIEIFYHQFGKSHERQTLVLPIEAAGYRIKRLKSGTPYVVCYNILFGTAVQSHSCLELVTKKSTVKPAASYFSSRYLLTFFHEFGHIILVPLIVLLVTLIIARGRIK